MSNSNRRSLDERVAEKQRLLEAKIQEMKACEAQLKALTAKKRDEDRKARTHRLIEIGGAVESVLGEPITHEMIPLLLDFLETQERNGKYFSKAMKRAKAQRPEQDITNEQGEVTEDASPAGTEHADPES